MTRIESYNDIRQEGQTFVDIKTFIIGLEVKVGEESGKVVATGSDTTGQTTFVIQKEDGSLLQIKDSSGIMTTNIPRSRVICV